MSTEPIGDGAAVDVETTEQEAPAMPDLSAFTNPTVRVKRQHVEEIEVFSRKPGRLDLIPRVLKQDKPFRLRLVLEMRQVRLTPETKHGFEIVKKNLISASLPGAKKTDPRIGRMMTEFNIAHQILGGLLEGLLEQQGRAEEQEEIANGVAAVDFASYRRTHPLTGEKFDELFAGVGPAEYRQLLGYRDVLETVTECWFDKSEDGGPEKAREILEVVLGWKEDPLAALANEQGPDDDLAASIKALAEKHGVMPHQAEPAAAEVAEEEAPKPKRSRKKKVAE